MLKKMLMVGISAFMIFTLGACGNSNLPVERNLNTDSSVENSTDSASKTQENENSDSNE